MRFPGFLILLASLTACATRPFVPADEDRRASDDHRDALYEIRTGAGDWNMITVTLRPEGIRDGPPDDAAGTAPPGPYAKLAFVVRNDWTSPVDLPLADLRLVARTKKGEQPPAAPLGTPAPARVAPGEERTIVTFLPLSAPEGDVRSFEVRWRLTSDGKSYRQTTTFVRGVDGSSDYTYLPYYDPFWYGWGGAESGAARWHSGLSIGFGVSN